MAKAPKLVFNDPTVILILPKGTKRPPEFIHLKPVEKDKFAAWTNELTSDLKGHCLRDEVKHPDVQEYISLYNSDGTLSAVKINALLDKRGRRAFEDTDPFVNRDDFDPMINRSLTRLRDEIARRKDGDPKDSTLKDRPFRIQPDPEPKEPDHADCFFVPDQIKGLTGAMKTFVERNNTKTNKTCPVSPVDAEKWDKGFEDGIPLRKKMEIVVDAAKQDRVIYHEPHHDLTPGMLLIDEIFRAMVEEVAVIIQKKLNRIDLADVESSVQDLQAFVNGLEEGMGDSGKFGAYILHAGDPTCPLHPLETYHVDPSRIELFLDGPEIRATSIIVGAWAGGTHSTGHTSP